MVSITLEKKHTDALMESLDNVAKNIDKEMGIVVWKVAKKTKSSVAKDVTKELAVTQKVVKQQLSTTRGKTTSTVVLKKSRRIPLRDFKARQTKKGVSYRISKTKGRRTAIGAFQGPKPGMQNPKWNGRVFKRVGQSRLPIIQLFGPSPFGVFTKNNRVSPTVEMIRQEINKQIAERVRYLKLKQSGTI